MEKREFNYLDLCLRTITIALSIVVYVRTRFVVAQSLSAQRKLKFGETIHLETPKRVPAIQLANYYVSHFWKLLEPRYRCRKFE